MSAQDVICACSLERVIQNVSGYKFSFVHSTTKANESRGVLRRGLLPSFACCASAQNNCIRGHHQSQGANATSHGHIDQYRRGAFVVSARTAFESRLILTRLSDIDPRGDKIGIGNSGGFQKIRMNP